MFYDESYRKFIFFGIRDPCLGTLMRMHDKEEKMPRLGPVCLIGCCLWVKGLHIVIKLQFFTSTFAALSGKFILQC